MMFPVSLARLMGQHPCTHVSHIGNEWADRRTRE